MLPKTGQVVGCQTLVPISKRDLSPCTFRGPSKSIQTLRPIILLGDSNAGQYSEGLVKAAAKSNRTVIVATTPGCSLVLVEVYLGSRSGRCLAQAQDTLEWLKHQPRSIVLVASANLLVDDDRFSMQRSGDRETARSRSEKAAAWKHGLTDVFNSIKESGHIPAQIVAIPHFLNGDTPWTPSECSFPTLARHPERCIQTQSLAAGNNRHRMGLEAEESAARETSVSELDLRPHICPEQTCVTSADGIYVYREGMHLTVGMSSRLAPTFAPFLRSLDSAN